MNSNHNPTTPQLGLFLNPPTYSHPYPFLFLYFFLAIIVNTSFLSPLSLSLLPSSWSFKFKEKEHVEEEPRGDLWRREVPCNSKQMKQVNFFKCFCLPLLCLPPLFPFFPFSLLIFLKLLHYSLLFFLLDFCVFIAIKLFNETPWQSSTIKLVIPTCESQNMQCLFELTVQYPIHFHLCI